MASLVLTSLIAAGILVADFSQPVFAGATSVSDKSASRIGKPDRDRHYGDGVMVDPTDPDSDGTRDLGAINPGMFDNEVSGILPARAGNSCKGAAEQALAMTGGEVLSVVAARSGKPICKVTVLVVNARGRPKRIKLRIPMDY